MGQPMTRMFRIALVALVGVGQLLAVPHAQTPANSGEQFGPRSTPPLNLTGPIPRTADNKPVLRGAWNSPPLFYSHMLGGHLGGLGIPPGRSVVIGPPDGIIPYQPWALAQRKENRRSGNGYLDNEGRCIISGVPRVM